MVVKKQGLFEQSIKLLPGHVCHTVRLPTMAPLCLDNCMYDLSHD